MTRTQTFSTSSVPPTPGEAAAAAASWERRGVLRRLVRLDREAAPPRQAERSH